MSVVTKELTFKTAMSQCTPEASLPLPLVVSPLVSPLIVEHTLDGVLVIDHAMS